MPIPYHGPTSAQFAPKLGQALASNQVVPLQSTGFAYQPPMVSYVVQPEDTLSTVTQKLYGANTPANRRKVRNAGFHVGNVIHAPALIHDPTQSQYHASL